MAAGLTFTGGREENQTGEEEQSREGRGGKTSLVGE